MSYSYELYGDWERHNGNTVLIDGLRHTLRVSVWDASYPYHERKISVYAEPTNKRTKHYMDVRADLGDDWETDVLSSIDLLCEVKRQLEG